MIQFTAQELADFIEAIRFEAKKEMDPVKDGPSLDLSALAELDGKMMSYSYDLFPRISAKKSNNMTDEEIDKAHDEANASMDGRIVSPIHSKIGLLEEVHSLSNNLSERDKEIDTLRQEIKSLKMANEGERKSIEYWKERCEELATDLKGARDYSDSIHELLEKLPSGNYKFRKSPNRETWEMEYGNGETLQLYQGTRYGMLRQLTNESK